MLVGNMDAYGIDSDSEHDLHRDCRRDGRDDDWGLDDLEIDADLCCSDMGAFVSEASREADLAPRLSAMDFDVMDYDDIDLPEIDSLLADVCVADGGSTSFTDLLGASEAQFQDLSASSSSPSFCSEIQLKLLRQPLPATLVRGIGCQSGGCSDPACGPSHRLHSMPVEQSVSSSSHMCNPAMLTPSPQAPRTEAPSAPAGPGPAFQMTPASSASENYTMGGMDRSSPPGSSSGDTSAASPSASPEHSGAASASAPKRARGPAATPATQANPALGGPRGFAQKRLRSPDARGPAPEDPEDAGSPTCSSDEGPTSSGDSTGANASLTPAVEASKMQTTGELAGPRPNQAPPVDAPAQARGVLHSLNKNGGVLSGLPHMPGAPAGDSGPAPAQENADSGDNKENDKEEVQDDEAKKAQRMQRNRESALLSRQRRRMQLDDLQKKNKELEAENVQLKGCLGRLQAESHSLRAVLAQICNKHGEQMPQGIPMPMPMSAVPMTAGIALPFGFPAMMPYPVGVQVPAAAAGLKVPIQKLAVPARPAPAAKPAPPSKRAKTVRGPATVGGKATFAAAFCGLFIFATIAGPPLGQFANRFGSSPTSMQLPALTGESASESWDNYSLALPASEFEGGHGSGRVLMSTDTGPPLGNLTVGTAVSLVQAVWDTVSTREWGASQPLYDECIQRNDPQVEALALQRLKELGPVAVISGWDKEPLQPPPSPSPAPWRSFSGMASSVLSTEGLLSPATCEEVFTIDAESLADPIAARRKLQAYLSTMQTFRGRSIGAALPLPPIGGLNDEPQQEVANRSTGRNATIGCPKEDGDLLVSILLPTKAPVVGGDAHLTSLDRIFVVVLKPSNKYSTYACGLQKPVLV